MFSLSPFSTFIPLSINMSLNWIQVHSSLQIWRRLLVYACSLSLHICYSYLNNILITYVNVTTTQPHPPPPQKKMLRNMQITGCICIQIKQINSPRLLSISLHVPWGKYGYLNQTRIKPSDIITNQS